MESVFPVKLVDFSGKQGPPFLPAHLKQQVGEYLSTLKIGGIAGNQSLLEEKLFGDILLQDTLEPAWSVNQSRPTSGPFLRNSAVVSVPKHL